MDQFRKTAAFGDPAGKLAVCPLKICLLRQMLVICKIGDHLTLSGWCPPVPSPAHNLS